MTMSISVAKLTKSDRAWQSKQGAKQLMDSLRILLLEDSLLDAELIQNTLVDGGINGEFIRVDNCKDFVDALETDSFNLILCDYSLPGFDGSSALDLAQVRCPNIPFILVSAALGEELAIETLKRGATDYVLKHRLGRLVPSVRRALRETRERKERLQAEQALRESEARFQRLVANMPGMIYQYSPCINGSEAFSYVSSGVRDLFGVEPEAAIQDANVIWSQIHPDDLPSLRESIAISVQQSLPWQWEGRIVSQSGEVKWIQGKSRPQQFPGYKVWDGLLIDITDRKQTEQALRLSENRYRSLANAIPQLLWVNDADGEMQFFNQRWQAYTGIVDLTLGVELWHEVIHPDDLQSMSKIRDTAIAAGEPYEIECRLKRFDQTYRWHLARIVPLKDELGQVLYWYGTATDIDDIKQIVAGQRFLAEASSALAASLNYQTTLNNIAQLAVPFLADYCFFDVVTSEETIERVAWHHVNPAKREWMSQIQNHIPSLEGSQHPVAQVLLQGKSMLQAVVTDEWLHSIAINPEHLQFMQAAQLRSFITVPLMVQSRILGALTFCFTADSHRHYTQADLALANELAHRAALALDNAQLYQQAQDANRAKDQFLAVLSHELRTPLNPIMGWAKLLQSTQKDPATVLRGLQAIERNAKLQTQLIEDLLDISRILRGELRLHISKVDLKPAIEKALETVHLAAEAKSIQIQTQFDANVGYVAGDAGRLQQVVWNLLSNAVKFTPEGGRVDVSLKRVDSYAQIQVKDTGKGITSGFLPYIFDYFRQADSKTTRKFGGLGLGLTIVRHIVEMHGGTVQAVSSGEGQGTLLTVTLPLLKETVGWIKAISQNSASPAPETNHSILHSLENVRVLVVDDEADTLELLTSVLRYAGATVTAVASATDALSVFAQSKPDILVSDISMPGMDGYELMRRIKRMASAIGETIAAIALTAYAEEVHEQQALAAGFQQHMTKPVKPDELVQAIAMLVEQDYQT
jgi:PAS domain S-box-containing protein